MPPFMIKHAPNDEDGVLLLELLVMLCQIGVVSLSVNRGSFPPCKNLGLRAEEHVQINESKAYISKLHATCQTEVHGGTGY